MRRLLDLRAPGGAGIGQVDPTEYSENDFEFRVVKALGALYPGFHCICFRGTFAHEGQSKQPDLALFSPSLNFWHVIEVELASHPLETHVLPQARAFRFGEPQSDCAVIIARELRLELGRARTLVEMIPRSVAVIVNDATPSWLGPLRALDTQLLTMSVFRDEMGEDRFYEMSGDFEVRVEHLGFGQCLRADRSLRLPVTVDLQDGPIHVRDVSGTLGVWRLRRQGPIAWLTKERGEPGAVDGSFVQVVRTFDGVVMLRSPG